MHVNVYCVTFFKYDEGKSFMVDFGFVFVRGCWAGSVKLKRSRREECDYCESGFISDHLG